MIIAKIYDYLILMEDEDSLYLCSYCDVEYKCIEVIKNDCLSICSKICVKYDNKFHKLNLYNIIKTDYNEI